MNVGLEQVVLLEADQIFHPSLLGVVLGFLDTLGIYVDTHTMSAVVLGGGNYNTAVTTAKIVNNVGLFHIGKFQHRLNRLFGGWDEGYIRLPPRLAVLCRDDGNGKD